MQYQPLQSPRFTVETVDGHDLISVKADRHLFISAFMLVWLSGWTFGGMSAMAMLFRHFSPFLIFWLGAWAVGWCFVVLQLGWFWTGAELFSVINGDLEIAYRILGVTIRKLFRGRDIRSLTSRPPPPFNRYRVGLPFASFSKSGCVQFFYGARTIYAGSDLDEVEGRLIVERLLKRLPASASAPP